MNSRRSKSDCAISKAEFSEIKLHGPKIANDVAEIIAEMPRNTLAAVHWSVERQEIMTAQKLLDVRNKLAETVCQFDALTGVAGRPARCSVAVFQRAA